MNITKITHDNQIILSLSGRLDTTTAPEFQQRLLTEIENSQLLILDFSDLVYVSSAGLRTLLMGQKAVARKGQRMVLRAVSEEIMEVFDMTGFSEILTIEGT